MAHIDILSELEVEADGEKPWCDLAFEVERWSVEGSPAVIDVTAVGDHYGEEVGFRFRYPLTGWTSDAGATGPRASWGPVSLLATGTRTDRLLRLYEEWFDLPMTSEPAVERIDCTAVILDCSVEDARNVEIMSKLFFDTYDVEEGAGAEKKEAQIFLNFDVRKGRVQLREKDPEFRSPLVAWLAGRYRHPVGTTSA